MAEVKEIYRIIDRTDGSTQCAYSRAYHNEWEWDSVSNARNALYGGVYEDKSKYKVAKYKVTVTLINDDVDNAEEVPIYQETPDDGLTLKQRMDKLIINAIMEV